MLGVSTEAPPRYTVRCCARGSLFKARATRLQPINRDRKAVKTASFKLRRALKAFFGRVKAALLKRLQAEMGKLAKAPTAFADDDEDEIKRRVDRIIADMDFDGYEAFASVAAQEFEMLARDGAAQAEKQLVSSVGPISVDAVNLANEEAAAWARDRAAEMVGKKWVDGALVDNPDTQWAIPDATREMLGRFVTDALENGYTNDELADSISAVYAFSDERSELIARTETARADVEGNLAMYSASGLVEGKEWLTAPDCCDECQELDGEVVPLDGQFASTVAGPPLHPQCRCDVLPVLSGDDGGEKVQR